MPILNGPISNRPAILTTLTLLYMSVFMLTGCDRQQQTAPAARPVPEVAVLEIQPQRLMLTTELPGRTTAFRTAEIRPQVSGLLMERLFTEGSTVEKGQLLYRIDPAPF